MNKFGKAYLATASFLVAVICLSFSTGVHATNSDEIVGVEENGYGNIKAEETGIGLEYDAVISGGGYAASGQLENIGYSTKIYDASNGLPTSDANYILGASDGSIWIGGYSGIIKYDGTTFTRLDTSGGLANGRALFEDSKHRIWVGTNDTGVCVIDGYNITHLTYKDGLPSSSIRDFAEDNEGNVYIGTTSGICYADEKLIIHNIGDSRLNEERILKMDSDSEGNIYGQTKNGVIFMIVDNKLTKVYSGEALNIPKITSILADPNKTGYVYLGTTSSTVYYGRFGTTAYSMDKIYIDPVDNVHWLSYDCGRVWISSVNEIGYLDENNNFVQLNNLPIDSGIEMTTSDYQGNIWVASSTVGIMKIVANSFVDVLNYAGLDPQVTYSTCIFRDDLYIGTDKGLIIIDKTGNSYENKLTEYFKGTRIRCIKAGNEGDIWFGAYTNDIGLVHLKRDGSVEYITKEDGLASNEIRCLCFLSDGTLLVGTNGGLSYVNDGAVTKSITGNDGLKNTTVLTVEEGVKGVVYVGTDGGGMYEINGPVLKQIGRDEGLTSDVVMRIKEDTKRGVYWIITSNSIQFMKKGEIYQVTSFPYNNNYDLYFDKNDYMWIVSSWGVYMVDADSMVNDKVTDYRLYTIENGLTGTPTSNAYSTLTSDGFFYISGRNGVCKINIYDFFEQRIPVKAMLGAVYSGEDEILPDANGVYKLPSDAGRIIITPSVMDYTLLNPTVSVYMEGYEDQGYKAPLSNLNSLEYTGLSYGKYTLHILVTDSAEKYVIDDKTFQIEKSAKFRELPIVRFVTVMVVALLVGFIVFRVMKRFVVNKQYEQIKAAKEEAERANTAKSRFLANMSHEIRTPINTIMGMNEMMLREDATGVPKGYFMNMMNYSFDIRNASESLLGLINDVLDMSKIESGKMNLVEIEYDTQEMLRSIVSMIRMRSTEKELLFDVVIDEILPTRMYGDAGKIKQIVLNLLTNALKYTEVGGFALHVSLEERENDICKLRFSVKDTGIGVKEEDMEALFTAYERLDEQKNSGIQGTGLGLDISRRFAELMGGTLVCESVYGQGSDFILTVSQKIIDKTPIGIFMEHDTNAAAGPYVPQFIAPDADILVVDDTPMNLSVIRGLLKATKVFVTTATSGEEALDKIRETRFNVVLLDHMMPGMDGIETCAKIREFDKDLPVYALTANATSGEEFYISKGFNGYLSKPIDSLALEKAIMKHLPEAMMKKPEASDAVEDITEIPENMLWIKETEGIDATEGIKNSGGVSSYIYALKLFYDTISDNIKVIRDAYDAENIRLYTIKVHALKSSARIIGALELSALALRLEEAGNKDDREFIDAHTDELLKNYEAFIEKLSGLDDAEAEDDTDKETIPDEELKEAYEALSEMIPQMDYDSVEMILDQLKDYALPAEAKKAIKEIGKLLKLFDWEGMENALKKVYP